jgi:hypothetical protein
MSRLANDRNQTEDGWNGLEGKKKEKCHDTEICSNFLVA